MSDEAQIDTNKYSRQIGTFGMEAMGKLIKLRVAIVGLRGNGVEIAKNLILAGPKSVIIYDDSLTVIEDLTANFYLSEENVGRTTRADACINSLKKLNADVDVNADGNVDAAVGVDAGVGANAQASYKHETM